MHVKTKRMADRPERKYQMNEGILNVDNMRAFNRQACGLFRKQTKYGLQVVNETQEWRSHWRFYVTLEEAETAKMTMEAGDYADGWTINLVEL